MLEIKEPITNECYISKEELVKASKKAILKQTMNFSIIGLIIFIMGLIFLILKFAIKLDNSYLIIIFLLLICGLLISLLPFIITLFMPTIMKKQNPMTYNGFSSNITFNFDYIETNVSSDSYKSNNIFKYQHIYKVNIYDDIVFMYLNSNLLYMFKLDGFSSDEDKNIVLDYIMAKR